MDINLTSFNGRQRAIIENVTPEIDSGRFPIKRAIGETVVVEADIFADGHDVVDCRLRFRKKGLPHWSETPFQPVVNDRWTAEFTTNEIGRYEYTVLAWVDRTLSWIKDLKKRSITEPDIEIILQVGTALLDETGQRARGEDAEWLKSTAKQLASTIEIEEKFRIVQDPKLSAITSKYPDLRFATQYDKSLEVVVDPVKARFSTWYELFPRSCSTKPGQHGTFGDVEAQLPRIAEMGFDVLYLPPIHPIGRTYRKGKNNTPEAQPGDVGSPWGIGASEGGHTAIHPELGNLTDFQRLIRRAKDFNIDIAMDLAYQCSPDHPWVKEHPEWFRQRPDGSIQYAENPPKKYQDIYPIDFESDDWQALWQALAEVVDYWIKQGITIFRVDNPHTKAFAFWEWMINRVKHDHPNIIFLSEAFTRPKIMYRLAKLGFTQSYTYFTWRNTKPEITAYFTELTQGISREFFRPNLWPNTPDILPEYLQWSGRPGFVARLILAATLGASYGIYGPAYELGVDEPFAPGKEEYLNSEKYQITAWKLGGSNDISELITRVNRIRLDNLALQSDQELVFHSTDNPEIICYSKRDRGSNNCIVTIVNLDPRHTHSCWIDLKLNALDLQDQQTFQAHDLLTGARYLWQGSRNFVILDPQVVPAHILRIRQHVRSEHDFDYFM